jgi:NAD(P)-dependent dehydrogenase (short-subunit alcohol dehydrogenase family)
VAAIDIAAPVSNILDFEPATVENLCETRRLVTSSGGRWSQHIADQRKIEEIRTAAETIVREWGGVDIVFANAGIQASSLYWRCPILTGMTRSTSI